jgi:tetratricopeptide (TPR) repeat protein
MISLQKRFLPLFILFTALNFSCGNEKNSEKNTSLTNRLDSLSQLAEQYPDSIQVLLSLQEAIYIDGDTTKALVNLLSLIKKFPANKDLQNAVALIQLQKGDTTNAIKALLHSLATDQNQPDVEFELAFLEAAQKNENALIIADRMINRYTERDIQAKGHFSKGIYYANTSLPKQAIQEFDSAIIKNFTLVDAYVEKGILLLETGKINESIATLSKATALDKNNADILFWLGKAYQEKKEFNQALIYFSETLKLDPSNNSAKSAIEEINK